MIKIGFCVSYDWYLMKHSLPLVYPYADKICLAIDKQRRAWTGDKFEIEEEAFYRFVKESDPDNKILLLEADLVDVNLNARQNCNRHRHLIADALGKGGWHVQIDSDEYFTDFKAFVEGLKRINPNPSSEEEPMNVCCPFYVIYKEVEGGFLMVDNGSAMPEMIPMATTRPQYERARQNNFYNYYLDSPVLHQSWARSEEELWFKINNWGHSAEELQKRQGRVSYFNLWKSLDCLNYFYVKNIHPVQPEVWPALSYHESSGIESLVDAYKGHQGKLPATVLLSQNNRTLARIKFHLGKMFKG